LYKKLLFFEAAFVFSVLGVARAAQKNDRAIG